MAPLPKPFSRQAHVIESAISEGRAEEAMYKLADALRSGNDRATRLLAANWIETIGLRPGDAKALRKGNNKLREDWLDISEMHGKLMGEGMTFKGATDATAEYFGCSDRHVEKCVAEWRAVSDAAREID